MILTGGEYTLNKVSVFDKNGFVEQLPDLLTGRRDHACGIFINNDKNKVLNQTKPKYSETRTYINKTEPSNLTTRMVGNS